MKYRIIETPQVDSEPLFWIEAWGHRMNTSLWGGKDKECWCEVTKTGNPINRGYRSEHYSDYLGSFKSEKAAKSYLDKIIEYQKKEVKTVFEIET